MRKHWKGLVAAVLAVSLAGQPVCVYAARTREEIQQERENKKNEQKSTQSQYKESQGKLNDLEEEQEVLQEEINELDAQLVEVIASVSLMEDQIVETEGQIAKAQEDRRNGRGRTIVFIDEIHRFNKAQQDAFLPFVEKGSIILIGATTENPSFEINSALLSRCRVFVLHSLSNEELVQLIRRALTSPKGLGYLKVDISSEMIEKIAAFANGDARTALNVLEMAVANGEITGEKTIVTMDTLMQCIGKKSLLYDKKGEEHYNLISALHKSMRNSDPDAAVYWLARMLEAGEDPLYVARRLVRFASEDIGMADSNALPLAVAAYQACHFLGMPECNVHLSHAVIYLSTAPKSNSSYMAYEAAKEDAKEMLAEPVPLVIRNAPTDLMKELHYGDGYVYAHDTKEKIVRMQCLPDSVKNRVYYRPGIQGDEKVIKLSLIHITEPTRPY